MIGGALSLRERRIEFGTIISFAQSSPVRATGSYQILGIFNPHLLHRLNPLQHW